MKVPQIRPVLFLVYCWVSKQQPPWWLLIFIVLGSIALIQSAMEGLESVRFTEMYLRELKDKATDSRNAKDSVKDQ
jgi:hypothetical protein